MAILKNSEETVITDLVGGIVPNYKTTKVVKQLLSGSHHIQTIGTGARTITADVLAEPTVREMINLAESTGEPLRLETQGKYYVGIIEATLKWKRVARDIYQTSLVLLVSEEGDLEGE